MENPALNKTERELKNEDIELKMGLLECAKSCFNCYLITKNDEFIKLGKELIEQANHWENEAQSRKTL